MEQLSEHTHLEKIQADLEELISLTAQNADKSAVNLTTKLESIEKQLEEKDNKRWSGFRWAVSVFLIAITVVIPVLFIALDKMHDQVSVLGQRMSTIEANDKDQPSHKDLVNAVRELEKKDAALEVLMKECVTNKDLSYFRQELINLLLANKSK